MYERMNATNGVQRTCFALRRKHDALDRATHIRFLGILLWQRKRWEYETRYKTLPHFHTSNSPGDSNSFISALIDVNRFFSADEMDSRNDSWMSKRKPAFFFHFSTVFSPLEWNVRNRPCMARPTIHEHNVRSTWRFTFYKGRYIHSLLYALPEPKLTDSQHHAPCELPPSQSRWHTWSVFNVSEKHVSCRVRLMPRCQHSAHNIHAHVVLMLECWTIKKHGKHIRAESAYENRQKIYRHTTPARCTLSMVLISKLSIFPFPIISVGIRCHYVAETLTRILTHRLAPNSD